MMGKEKLGIAPLLERHKRTYGRTGRGRMLYWVGLTTAGILLYLCCGAPGESWLVLFQVLRVLPSLVSLKGPFVLVLLAGTLLWSVAQSGFWFLFFFASAVLAFWEYGTRQKKKGYEWHMKEQSLMSTGEPSTPGDEGKQQGCGTRGQPLAERASPVARHYPMSSSSGAHAAGRGREANSASRPFEKAPTSAITIESGWALDAGRRRSDNQDNLSTYVLSERAPHRALFIVADGVGGQAKGQEASLLAVETVNGTLLPILRTGRTHSEEEYRELLTGSVQQANLALCQRNYGKPNADQMNTTITVALLVGTDIYIANVGDSRTYVYRRESGLERVTRDHSYVEYLVETHQIQREDVYSHPQRNQIVRSLGDKALLQVDLFSRQVTPGSSLLLCSDGVWEMVRDPEIEQVLQESGTAQEKAGVLLKKALENGGEDNISLIVVRFA